MDSQKDFFEPFYFAETYGYVEGFVAGGNRENIENFLLEHLPNAVQAKAMAGWLRAHGKVVTVITRLYVEAGLRGMGFGTRLMGRCFEVANDNASDTMLLFCYSEDQGPASTRLENWYAEFDFEVVTQVGSSALMAFPIDTAVELSKAIWAPGVEATASR